MEELFVSNAVYAATKAAPTVANGATSPDLLANGSVGIYSVSGTTGKPVLLTAAATGLISELNLIFAQGTASGCIVSKTVKPKWLKSFHGAEYAPAIKEVAFLGYNGTSGTLNLNLSTLKDYDDAGVQVISRLGLANPEDDYTTSSAYLLASDTAYTAAGKVSPAVNIDARVDSYVIANVQVGAVVAVAASGITLVNGSAVVSGITGGITLNNYLTVTIDPQTGLIVPIATGSSISNIYRVIAVGGSSVTLDRPFEGVSQAITAANFNLATTSSVTAPTSVGIAFVSNFSTYQTFEVLGEGAFINATRTLPSAGAPAIGMFPGAGTADQVKALELRYQNNSGFWATADQWIRQQWTSAVTGTGYDLYLLKFSTVSNAYGANEDRVTNEYTLSLAVQDGTTFGNATIDAIMDSISSATGTPVGIVVPEQTGDLNPGA
jgi:hypothetical protein